KIYINGVLETSGDHPDNKVNETGAPVWIGELDANRGFAWNGVLDEVRIYSHALSEVEIFSAMEGKPWPYAFGPDPADGALHEDTWVNLAWKPGQLAVSHDVYLGDNLDAVESDDVTGETFRGNQTGMFYVAGFPGFAFPDGLVPGTTYYWRIDEVNDADPNSPWKGDVWSFSIPPKTAYNPDPADGAEFVDPNATFTWTGGFGAKLHTVYIDNSFDDVNNAVGGTPLGSASYDPGTLELEEVYYWRVDEFDAFDTFKGDVWSFTTPGAVGNPQPANSAVNVQMIATLSWTAADNAASHELYFGTDKDAVNNATTASSEYVAPKALGAESYDPGKLAWNTAYHWRVDEVYPAETVKGLVWSFTTADFILVSNRIFDKWIDGFGTTDNGALVGNDLPPYAEQTIVHGGAQSMPYLYDNANKTSEATLTLVYPRDWTEEGVTKLSLWFRGGSANAADRMFVALNGNAVVYHKDPAATQKGGWNQWIIDLQAFADQGVNLTNVNTITIGIGTKGSPAAAGTGTMYFDDIRLYR
ncbi:MAG: LamG-like jellyroll fold domain-containing protein, partial [Planctomycetota bacterium]